MRKIFLLILLGIAGIAEGSHIVGGEFELLYIQGSLNRYKLNMILYFDFVNGSSGAYDPTIFVRIFRKRDNAIMENSISMNAMSNEFVDYTQPECSIGSLRTLRIFYTTEITLSPDRYNDPEGYYIAWERCCRNYTITNIYSQNPDIFSLYAGQTFYLEFPAVVKDGLPFINSSPKLFPPLSDYACPFKDYYVDFAGVDDDGDSLVYSLVTPLSTITGDAFPPGNLPRPGPYPPIIYQPGFSSSNIVNGDPDLKISDDGFLTVRPQTTGLFVFAVRCEEYRDGVKIGEVRRDFQMLVVDGCTVAEPPQIVGRRKGTGEYTAPNQALQVSFNQGVSNSDRCIEIAITDPDSQKPQDNFRERVFFRVFPLNFKSSSRYLTEVTPINNNALLTNGSTANFQVCLPECSYIPGLPYEIGIIAYDDACSLPLSDTLKVTVFVEDPPNQKPAFLSEDITASIQEGDIGEWFVEATDSDNDLIGISISSTSFTLANVGMSFSVEEQINGYTRGRLVWDPRCNVYDFTQQTTFELKILADDVDACLRSDPDTTVLELTVELPNNNDPVITTSLDNNAGARELVVEQKVFESLSFSVSGLDEDDDLVLLNSESIGFTADVFQLDLGEVQGTGSVEKQFNLNIQCQNLVEGMNKSEYNLRFIAIDNNNKCSLYQADTLDVLLVVLPPDNIMPELRFENLNPDVHVDGTNISSFVNTPIQLNFIGTDDDVVPADELTLKLIEVPGNVSDYSFPEIRGTRAIESLFAWTPECRYLSATSDERMFTFKFLVSDRRCYTSSGDTITLDMVVRDYDRDDSDFQPMNFITPNGDGCNDYFAMANFDATQHANCGTVNDVRPFTLPDDTCLGNFVSIRIYDRWGNQLFESADRNFKWGAEDAQQGVYFYYLFYTHRSYRGTISVRY